MEVDVRNVFEAMQHVRSHMFEPIPEAGGFNSTRIAEILNFRDRLSPAVVASHLHALLPSPTSTEREISKMVRVGTVQKLNIVGRGTGVSTPGQSLALTADFDVLLRRNDSIDQQLRTKFSTDLEKVSVNDALSTQKYSNAEIGVLMRCGFLTTKSASGAIGTSGDMDSSTLTSISSISSAASGSLAAVGGRDAILNAGGSSHQRPKLASRRHSSHSSTNPESLQLSLPGTGVFLNLVLAARQHLVSIVRKTRFQEVPTYLLKERWDGGISSDDSASKAKKYRGEFAGVLPARTQKWKKFYGMTFEWVLAECLGANLIEQFETGSVGKAVRLV